MRVGIYIQLARMRIRSGVPRHIREVVDRLLTDETLDTHLFVNEEEAHSVLPSLPDRWHEAPRISFDRSPSLMTRLWGLLGWPPYESFGGDADWLYLPADSYVPTRSARIAATIHDVYRLDEPAPGTDRLSFYKTRLRHRLLFGTIARNADKVLTVSKFTADRLMHHFDVPPQRLHVVYNGVNDAFLDPPSESVWSSLRTRLGIPEEAPLVTSVGGLKAKKNATGLIEAWQTVESQHDTARLVLVGHHDDDWRSEASSSLQRLIFADALTDEELSALLAHSQGQFLPSWYEGFGIPALEALAVGTPVVLSDIPAFREIVGDLGIYVDPARPKHMAGALLNTLSDETVQKQIRRDGPDLARQYTWDACARRVKEALHA